MQNNQRNWTGPDQDRQEENHRVGRDLYNRDQERDNRNQNSDNHSHNPQWNMGNNFHTGYSNQSRSHFPEDTHQRTSNADWGGSHDKHYGVREYSTYRSPNNLNYGDGRGHSSAHTRFEDNTSANRQHNSGSQNHSSNQHSSNSHFAPYGDGRGNYNARQDSYGNGYGNDHIHSERVSPQRRMDDSNENYYRGAYMDDRGVKKDLPNPSQNPYNEYPGSRSRYKDDDYRYGSGNHTWYEERRYTDDTGRRADRDKGDILDDMGAGIRDAWHDLKHGAQNMWHRDSSDNNDRDRSNRHDSNYRGGNRNDYEYRSRRDRGYESGPRWSDETDSGDDSFFYSDGRNPRYY
ncbi:hypothetical protein [Rufibacter roseus]|uniref:SWFGD domain-containing protein n=1 Tax=Rufibacter roseus TaxID=1567108 RepID=A0ABW2DJH7_9BACT|nr:hypothetical protein [Rufibacter roseus]